LRHAHRLAVDLESGHGGIDLDATVVRPKHVHLIFRLIGADGPNGVLAPRDLPHLAGEKRSRRQGWRPQDPSLPLRMTGLRFAELYAGKRTSDAAAQNHSSNSAAWFPFPMREGARG
jgi:hypothetical protein